MDQIHIRGLSVFAYHGVNEEEKQNGQRFIFHCTVYLPLALPLVTDRVEDTVSYAKILKLIAKTATDERYDLLERLGGEIIARIFRAWPEIQKIKLTIEKPDIDIAGHTFDAVGVTLIREKGDA